METDHNSGQKAATGSPIACNMLSEDVEETIILPLEAYLSILEIMQIYDGSSCNGLKWLRSDPRHVERGKILCGGDGISTSGNDINYSV
ncbi:hypothetical protein ABG067_007013 [Albugo candida]